METTGIMTIKFQDHQPEQMLHDHHIIKKLQLILSYVKGNMQNSILSGFYQLSSIKCNQRFLPFFLLANLFLLFFKKTFSDYLI